jgi:hypothetical protein
VREVTTVWGGVGAVEDITDAGNGNGIAGVSGQGGIERVSLRKGRVRDISSAQGEMQQSGGWFTWET